MKYVVVLPYVLRDFRDECMSMCRFDNVLEVDNTANNLGVMRSHNLGVDAMRELDADWLLIMSAAVRFGPEGGLDFVRALETTHRDCAIVNAVGLFGWHLMAFSRECVERAGRWDEQFSPYGFDDNDYAIRIRKAHPDGVWWGVTGLEVADTMMGHSLKLGGVSAPATPRLAYFVDKWGLPPGAAFEEYRDHPWADVTNPVGFWPPVADGGRWDGPAPSGQEQCTWVRRED